MLDRPSRQKPPASRASTSSATVHTRCSGPSMRSVITYRSSTPERAHGSRPYDRAGFLPVAPQMIGPITDRTTDVAARQERQCSAGGGLRSAASVRQHLFAATENRALAAEPFTVREGNDVLLVQKPITGSVAATRMSTSPTDGRSHLIPQKWHPDNLARTRQVGAASPNSGSGPHPEAPISGGPSWSTGVVPCAR